MNPEKNVLLVIDPLSNQKKLDTFFVSYFLRHQKKDTFFLVLNVFKASEIAG